MMVRCIFQKDSSFHTHNILTNQYVFCLPNLDGEGGEQHIQMDDLTGYGGFTVREPAPNTIYYRQDSKQHTPGVVRPTIADLYNRFTVYSMTLYIIAYFKLFHFFFNNCVFM